MKASAYLVLKGKRAYYGPTNPETGLKQVETVQIKAVKQNRPATLETDEVCIKVAVEVPENIFDPIQPSALIVVSDDMVTKREEIQVEAGEANASTGS